MVHACLSFSAPLLLALTFLALSVQQERRGKAGSQQHIQDLHHLQLTAPAAQAAREGRISSKSCSCSRFRIPFSLPVPSASACAADFTSAAAAAKAAAAAPAAAAAAAATAAATAVAAAHHPTSSSSALPWSSAKRKSTPHRPCLS